MCFGGGFWFRECLWGCFIVLRIFLDGGGDRGGVGSFFALGFLRYIVWIEE